MEASVKNFRMPLITISSRWRKIFICLLIFAITLLAYYSFNINPAQRFQHQLYLANAILQGSFDVKAAGISDSYHDVVSINSTKYLPFPPGPALLLLPFVAVWGTAFSQIYFTMFLGAVNVALFWILLETLNIGKINKILLVIFFAFGTVHFYAATTGTVWYYNHVAAVFFLFLALISLFLNASPVLPALFLGFSYMCRQSTILSVPFFLFWIWRRNHKTFSKKSLFDKRSLFQLGLFCAVIFMFVTFSLWYNYARFGSPFDSGYSTIAKKYIERNSKYSFYRQIFPNEPPFNLFDVRNIPLHVYVIFFMPPEYVPAGKFPFRPSPYGMSVLLTSSAFIYAALARRKKLLKLTCWLAIGLISIPLLLHYNQGWKQFGYRFLLDFSPFLLILTALGFEDYQSRRATVIKILLVAISILVNIWGGYWAHQLW